MPGKVPFRNAVVQNTLNMNGNPVSNGDALNTFTFSANSAVGSYTLTASDIGKLIHLTNTSSLSVVVPVLSIPEGSFLKILASGDINVLADDTLLFLATAGSPSFSAGMVANFYYTGADTWYIDKQNYTHY